MGRIELHGKQAVVEIPDGSEARLVKALDGRQFGDRRVRAWTSSPPTAGPSDEDEFLRLARLLDLESRAEAQKAADDARRLSPEAAQQTGNTLLNLVVVDEEAGLGGRYLVHLGRRGRGPLLWTRLGVGSPVVLSPQAAKAAQPHRGVVCDRSERTICTALDRLPEDLADHDAWRLDLSFDEVATQRQRAALEQARLARGDRFAILRDVLVGRRQPEFGVDPQVRPLDVSLNPVQREAVQFALSARDVGLIHGPPGTGKTTAVVEVIRQAVRRGRKVLACARATWPSTTSSSDCWASASARSAWVTRRACCPSCASIRWTCWSSATRTCGWRGSSSSRRWSCSARRTAAHAPRPAWRRRELRADAKSLLADARRLESQAVDSILDSAAVLCATTTGLDSQVLGARRFDLAVIDEACQSTEPGCWIPLLRCDRVVLSGDHCQLPPTVVSREAAAAGFDVSLFERLMGLYGPQIARRLTVQYRMHEAIMGFSSAEFYDGRLEADTSVRRRLLAELPEVKDTPTTRSPLKFIDTAGASFDEELEPDGDSRRNPQEADLTRRKVQELLDSGLSPADIAVIAPYAAQVRLLREMLVVPGLEIDSVDGFQGREKEAVVISLVRSNPKGEIGFLADVRRMNVALTRASASCW